MVRSNARGSRTRKVWIPMAWATIFSIGTAHAQVPTITPTEFFQSISPTAQGQFGEAVDLDLRAVVANHDSLASVEVWFLGSDGWFFIDTLEPSPDPGTNTGFGEALATSGQTAIVGAPWDSAVGTNLGAAYLYHEVAVPFPIWSQTHRLDPVDPSPPVAFGRRVALDGETAVVSATSTAYVFERTHGGGNAWGQIAKLTEADFSFGADVAIHGDWIVVSAPFYDAPGHTNTGVLYLYRRNQGGPNAWGPVGILEMPVVNDNDILGGLVEIEASTDLFPALTIAASGSGFVALWRLPPFTATFEFEQRLEDPGLYQFGRRIALDPPDLLVAGNPYGDVDQPVYHYQRGFEWSLRARYLATEPNATTAIGTSLAISDGVALAGATKVGPMSEGAVFHLTDDLFGDGFESGNTASWSSTTP